VIQKSRFQQIRIDIPEDIPAEQIPQTFYDDEDLKQIEIEKR
jgi:hypothetical protein